MISTLPAAAITTPCVHCGAQSLCYLPAAHVHTITRRVAPRGAAVCAGCYLASTPTESL